MAGWISFKADCTLVHAVSTNEIKLVYSANALPDLKAAYLICGFPGSGYVGKLAVDHLIEELYAAHFGYSYHQAVHSSYTPTVHL